MGDQEEKVNQSARWVKSRPLRVLLWAGGAVAAYALLGFFAVPPIARHYLAKTLTEQLERAAAVERIEFNPFLFKARIQGLRLQERDRKGEALALDDLVLDLDGTALFRARIEAESLRVGGIRLKFARRADGQFSFSDLIEKFGKPAPEEPKAEPARFVLRQFELVDGDIEFDDQAVGQRHRLAGLRVTVPRVSNRPEDADTAIEARLEAVANGAPITLKAGVKPFAPKREGSLVANLKGLELPRYLAYAPPDVRLKLASGRLDADASARFSQSGEAPPAVALSGGLRLHDVDITEPEGAPVAKVGALSVKLGELDLAARKATIESVVVENGEFRLVRGKNEVLTLLRYIPAAGDETGDDRPFSFKAAEIRVVAAKVSIRDEAVTPPFEARYDRWDLTLRNLGNRPEDLAEADFSAAGGTFETLAMKGTLALAPVRLNVRVDMTGARISELSPYYASSLAFAVEQGTLGLSGDARLELGGDRPAFSASNVGVRLDDLRLRQPGAKREFFTMKSLAVSGGEFDLGKRSVSIAEVAARGGRIEASRARDGSVSLAKLVTPARDRPAGSSAKTESGEGAGAPWMARIDRVKVAGFQYAFEDRVPPVPVQLAGELTELAVSNVSAEQGAEASYSLKARMGRKGLISGSGKVRQEPLKVVSRLEVTGIDLVSFQPYFADRLNVSATSGFLAMRGELSLDRDRSGQVKGAFRGDTGLEGLNAVDSIGGGEVLNWRSLKATGIDAAYPPARVAIGKVSLEDFFSRVIIYTDGTLNLQLIVKPQAAPEAAGGSAGAAAAGTKPPGREGAAGAIERKPAPQAGTTTGQEYSARIDEVAVSGGTIDFSDNFIKPSYSADLKQIAGRVTGLSSEPGTAADLELRGTVSGTAPLAISGKLNPLARDLTLDIKANVKDFELSPLSAYSGKYAGYAIEKGKLSFDVNYRIENRKLQADNRLFLDQLTFGEKVDSPTATELPVLFAVSLLKNSRGEIDLNLPVSGSLDDPEFSIGGIVVQAIVNLIGKIVTAPFALIGSLFGGGEEMGFVEFDAGSHALSEKAVTKLAVLAKALVERPGLKLDVSGRADPEGDRVGLKRAALQQKVRAQKLAELAKQGESVENRDQVRVLPEEYPKFLELVFSQEKLERPKAAAGAAKSPPVEEMEKLLLANTAIDDEALRDLAQRRAQEAKDYLVTKGQVPAERVFIVAPKIVTAGEKADGGPSRAEFSLK